VYALLGPNAVLYLMLCDMFAMGFLGHPHLAFWVTQHHANDLLSPDAFVATGGVAGRAYNLLILNQGHHCEHHDFPQIPWTRLPRLSRIAPEFYGHVPPSRTWYNVVASYYWQTDRAFHYSTHPQTGHAAAAVPAAAGATA
jgi:sphingolipid delta-4 desaturase